MLQTGSTKRREVRRESASEDGHRVPERAVLVALALVFVGSFAAAVLLIGSAFVRLLNAI